MKIRRFSEAIDAKVIIDLNRIKEELSNIKNKIMKDLGSSENYVYLVSICMTGVDALKRYENILNKRIDELNAEIKTLSDEQYDDDTFETLDNESLAFGEVVDKVEEFIYELEEMKERWEGLTENITNVKNINF